VRLAVVVTVLAIAGPAAGAVEKGTFTPGSGGAGVTLGMTRRR
jgi:hypothetical protein